MAAFASAGPAEILRASQKDEVFSDRLQNYWSEILLKLGGSRLWMNIKHFKIGYLFYGTLTTLSGLQTLGEEYTGIVQVNSSKSDIPTFFKRVIMVLLDCFGSVIITSLCSQVEKYFKNNPFIRQKVKKDVLNCISTLKNIIPFIENFHRANFYASGGFFQLSKRLTGTHYVLARRWLKDYQSINGFRLLGFVTFVHLVIVSMSGTWFWLNMSEKSNINIEPQKSSLFQTTKGRMCTLCLEERRNVCTTPCGHLFCWTCIMDWLQTQNQCPLCRERITPSRVVHLKNHL
uniref:RING-type E3 ubiquitin transferase n=1 Tax=Clastoptera arizonana TaxID=38151 RepID=A0A1B6DJM2_9HEMI